MEKKAYLCIPDCAFSALSVQKYGLNKIYNN